MDSFPNGWNEKLLGIMYGNAEQTVIESYNLVYTGDGTDTEPTAFPLGITSGNINLLLPSYGGKGQETKANRLEMLFLADQAGSATIALTGACQGGPEEYIASLALTVGGTAETGTNRWVEDITLSSYHLAACGIVVADGGNNRVTKFGFDAIGYQFIRFYTTSFSNITWIKVYARYF